MPKVVPSQVVEVIDQVFPAARNQKNSQQSRFSVDRTYQNEVAAIVELVDQIPAELLILAPKDYTALQLAVTALKNTIPNWRLRSYGLDRIHGHGNLNHTSSRRPHREGDLRPLHGRERVATG